MMSQDERRVTFPEDVMEALNRYAAVERKSMKNDVVKRLITGKSIAQHIVLNELIKRGHYDPTTKKDTP